MSIEVASALGSAIGGLISYFLGYSVGRRANSRAFRSSVLERDVQRIAVNPSSDNLRMVVLESVNAKLRELVLELWDGYMGPLCEECRLKDTPTCADCPICAREAAVIDRMRELGIEVD